MASKTIQDQIITGTVENIDDPTCAGRIKVRVPGYHDNMKTEELPWCTYAGSNIFSGGGGGSISIPKVGSQVRVQFKDGKATSMEWTGVGVVDKELIKEIKNDYAGSHIILYDSSADLSIKYQPSSGLLLYFKGSHIQVLPDNTINIHYGEGTSGTQIQLSNGKVDIQAQNQINLTTGGVINLEADQVTINGKSAVQIKGDLPGECAVNGVSLVTALLQLAMAIDAKVPATGGSTQAYINSLKEGILNQQIQLI